MFNEFKTTVSGYKQLAKWVEQNSRGIDSSLWLFCGENTGDYSKGLCNFLYGKGYDIWLENAKSIKNASGIRRLKSDRADASMIAEYAMRNYDKAVMYESLSESLAQLRELFLYRQMVVRHRCSFQVRRGEKRLTMEKSPVKTMISQSGRHIVSELNKEIEKIDKRIASHQIRQGTHRGVHHRDIGFGHRNGERRLYDGIQRQLQQIQLQSKEDCLLLWYIPIRQGFWNYRAFRSTCAITWPTVRLRHC